MIYNDSYTVFAAGRHPRLLGSPVLEGWPEVADFNANVMRTCMAGGTLSYRDHELTLYRKGGAEQVWMNLDYSPVLDESAKPGGVLAVVVETTDRVLSEAAVRESETRLRDVLDGMSEGLALLDRNFRIIDMNAEALRYEGRPREEIYGKTHWEAHPTANPKLGELFRHAMANRVPVSLEHRYVWADGRVSWFSMHAYPVGDGLAVFYGDITKRVEAEEHQRLLMAELNHRVKNTLTTVQSLANQTFQREDQDTATRLTFEGRLFALAAAHDVLTREHWEGAGLREIVTGALAPYIQDGTERFKFDGPDLRLPPRMTLAIAMALHELATNAVKYGALSVVSGCVKIKWAFSGAQTFTLVWQEKGGPRVTPPTRRGFGTRLIERSLALELAASVRLTYEPTGVVCIVEAPLAGSTK
jgi:PAS domain S-box-containing protein